MPSTIAFHTHLVFDYPELIDELHRRRPELSILIVSESRTADAAAMQDPDAAAAAAPWAKRVDLPGALAEAEVLIAPPLPVEELNHAPRLAAHIIPFAGVNRAPLHWYRERGVLLASSHGNAPAVAERAVALALAAAGRVVEFDADLRDGLWHRHRSEANPFDFWRSLRGAATTILGAGAIGSECARLLRPLVGEITALRRSPVTATPGLFDRVTTDVIEAMSAAELVIAALPLTGETRGMLRREHFLAASRPVFVNVSRAEIVAEQTLLEVLRDGSVAAAGLDVWYRYPEPFWAPLVPEAFSVLRNVVLSPHAGSHAEAGKRGQLRGAMELLEEYLSTGNVADGVNPDLGY